MLGLQRSVGNHVVNTMLSSRIARDADIDALDLEATAKDGATDLKKKHAEITFTSGRRDWTDQAQAMAQNIVASKNRKWIEGTCVKSSARTKLQKWVDDNPEATSQSDLETGLKETLDGMSKPSRAC
jgi:hypothetical protein